MLELIEANWLLILLAVLVGFVIAWFLLSGSRKTKVTREEGGEEAPAARRNQALIDAPPAAAKDPPPPSKPEPEPAPAPAPAQEPAAQSPTVPPTVPPVATTGMAGAGTAVGAAVAGASEAAQRRGDGADDLTRLKGVGPKLAAQLNELGISSFEQIAGWTESDIDRIDDQLGRFKGRIRRDDWIAQAKLLTSGDIATYEARFGNL